MLSSIGQLASYTTSDNAMPFIQECERHEKRKTCPTYITVKMHHTVEPNSDFTSANMCTSDEVRSRWSKGYFSVQLLLGVLSFLRGVLPSTTSHGGPTLCQQSNVAAPDLFKRYDTTVLEKLFRADWA